MLYFGPFVVNAGYYGVIFFYTLSGFLITYLLLVEKKTTGSIAVGYFYKRRALRIWPLYYLIVLLSFFVLPWVMPMPDVLPAKSWKPALSLYLLFLPNIAGYRYYVPTCFHTYTIGYEEQFYLFWPLVLRRTGRRLAAVTGVLFFLPIVLEAVHLFIISHGLPLPGMITKWIRAGLTFIDLSNVPAFIAGAGGALFYLQGKTVLRSRAGKRWLNALLIIFLIGLMVFGRPGGLGYVNLLSLLFAVLIVNGIEWNPPMRSAGKAMVLGGTISYGIYIYHPVVLIFVSTLMAKMPALSPIVSYFLYLLVSLLLLLVLSFLSYRYFERVFLRRKERFRAKPAGEPRQRPGII